MFGYLGKRALHSVVSVLGLLVLVFFLTRLTGDPSYLFLPLDATPQAREAFSRLHGFDQPLYVQFFDYLGDLLHLDFGSRCARTGRRWRWRWRPFPRR